MTVVRRPVVIFGMRQDDVLGWVRVGVPSDVLREVVTTDPDGVHLCRPMVALNDQAKGAAA